MAHPLRRARWVVGSVIVVTLVVLFVNLGFWQLRRLDERKALNEAVRQQSREVTALPGSAWDADTAVAELENRRVELKGTYETRREVLVRFQTHEGQPGYDVVTPLRTDDGVVLVDRGWVPERLGDGWPAEEAAAPSGTVEVVGLLAGPDDTAPRVEDSAGEPVVVSGVRPTELARTLELEGVLPLYVKAVPTGEDRFPIADGEPDLSEGPHLNYAIQWFLFATVVGTGWLVLLWHTSRRKPIGEASGPGQSSIR